MTEAEQELGELRVRLRLMVGRWQMESDAWARRSDRTTDQAMARSKAYRETASALAALLDDTEHKP